MISLGGNGAEKASGLVFAICRALAACSALVFGTQGFSSFVFTKD